MRAAAITLLFLVIGFVVNAVFVFSNPSYRTFLQSSLGKEGDENAMHSVEGEKIIGNQEEEKKSVGITPNNEQSQELEKTLNRLADGLQALSGTSAIVPEQGILVSGGEGSGGIQMTTSSGVVTNIVTPPAPPTPKSLDLPLFLQAKLYPEYSFKKFDSKSPFGVSVFSNLEFATYRDMNRNVRVYVFKDSYATTIANFRMATNVYTVKEVDAFFEKTFFLNTVKKNDGMVRFVILEKTGVYGLEMPKGQYSKIKTYLQSK